MSLCSRAATASGAFGSTTFIVQRDVDEPEHHLAPQKQAMLNVGDAEKELARAKENWPRPNIGRTP